MDLGLKGKKAFVSGSTAGIGLAIAQALHVEGADVVINGRTQQRVDQALSLFKGGAGKVEGVAADLTTEAGAKTLLARVPRVDVLVNNLGIFEPKSFADITDDDWRRFFNANVLSGVRLARLYLPQMLERNWGRIIFISSESAVQTPVEMIHYGMTKTAQLAVARGLAETTAGTGVTVNSVLPGPTESEGVSGFVDDMAKQSGKTKEEVQKEFFQTVRSSSLLKRFATTEEIAAMVAYVASVKSAATNGTALRVDGGVVRSIL
jgi:NAD(P)-dependent dehydrogenase (short-subunit alcohol dehydrogenase family)